jgi:hypothetical protein
MLAAVEAFFAMIESGRVFALTKELEAAVDAGELEALRAAGWLRPADPVPTVPCDDAKRRCFRLVREADADAGAALPFVGVCRDAPSKGDKCAATSLAEKEVAQEELSPNDVVRSLRAIYAARGGGVPLEASFSRAERVLVGVQKTPQGERDVVLLPRPAAMLKSVLFVSRRTLFLLPLPHALADEIRRTRGPGTPVEFEVLARAVVARLGKLVRAAATAPAAREPDPPAAAPEPKPSRAAPARKGPKGRPLGKAVIDERKPAKKGAAIVAGAKHWSDVKMYRVDRHTVRVDVGARTYRFNFVDFDMFHEGSRKPTKLWEMLIEALENHGMLEWRGYGEYERARKLVSRLGLQLRDLFGLDESAFYTYEGRGAYRLRFQAYARAPRGRFDEDLSQKEDDDD